MKTVLAAVLLISFIFATGEANRVRRLVDVDWKGIGDEISDTFDCRKKNEECRQVPSCCGNLQCYWEHGYNPLGTGVCVDCVDRGLKCQRNSQCCDNLVCQKDNAYTINGVCDVPKPNESSCYADTQCSSHYCSISWYNMAVGKNGKCAPL